MKLEADEWVKLELNNSAQEDISLPSTSSVSSSSTPSSNSSRQHHSPAIRRPAVNRVHKAPTSPSSPAALQTLSLEALHQQLRNLCEERNYVHNKRGLKHYLKFLLPTQLRQQLMDFSTRDGRIYTLGDLNMFELLLSPTVKYVDIQSVRPFFRQPFAAMLRQLGNGLQDFVLEDSSWLQGRDVLSSALATMSGLQRISLRYLANDLMIAALAKNCHRLEEMDVSNSNDVTDAGMKVLCEPDLAFSGYTELARSPVTAKPAKRFRKISAPVLSSVGCVLWFRRGTRRHSNVQNPLQQHNNDKNNNISKGERYCTKEDDQVLLHLAEEEPTDTVTKLQCIRSLRRLDVHNTSVTPVGIQLILASSPTISILS